MNHRKGEILTTVVFAVAALALGALLLNRPQPSKPELGASIPKVVALFETSLASKINKTDASMTLVSGTDKAGNVLSGYIGFVIDEGTSSEEFVACTAATTALTGCIRGIDTVTGNTTSSALAFEHRRGASVKITTFPVLGVITRMLNGQETIPNGLMYATSTAGFVSSSAQLAHKAYVDAIAIAGAPDASTATKGISEIASCAELAAGTAAGDTSAPLVSRSTCFNQTSTATTVPVAKTSGKLSQGWLNLAEAWTFNATTTLASSTVFSGLSSGVIVGQGSSAATSVAPGTSGNVLRSNGTSWESGSFTGVTMWAQSTSSVNNVTVPNNTTTTLTTINIPAFNTDMIEFAVEMVDDGGSTSATYELSWAGTTILRTTGSGVPVLMRGTIIPRHSTSSQTVATNWITLIGGATTVFPTSSLAATSINTATTTALTLKGRHSLGSTSTMDVPYFIVTKTPSL